MRLIEIRQEYHGKICRDIIRTRTDSKKGTEYPNFADSNNTSSVNIALGIVKRLNYVTNNTVISEQTAGGLFEKVTCEFLEKSFTLLQHLRPGKWYYSTTQTAISGFSQYEHLSYLEQVIKKDKTLSSALGGDYIVKPDIVIGRKLVTRREVNRTRVIVDPKDTIAKLTPFLQNNTDKQPPILHASISCKWTIRSDRSQNARTEALNLIRNRKGHLPHIVAVTAEPLPTRIATLALGTGDIDCVYHFALPELAEAIKEVKNQDQLDILSSMVEGKRLRDISDLPFDLAV
ncbi:MAG: restriction endonuclease [Chloroflexi bacterium]|nr:restriction endonuclease [Chloroflexota bacterium]